MKTAGCGTEKRGTPTPHGEVENNSMSWAVDGPQELVDAGHAPLKTPGEAWISPRRRRGVLEHDPCSDESRARRAEAGAFIPRAANPNVRANMTASVRRALRPPTMARCVLRALETRRGGRMANGERRTSQEPFFLLSISVSILHVHCSSFAHLIPSARPSPTRWRHGSKVRTRLSRRSSFSDLAGPVPAHARQRLWPWRRHTLVWSPFGGVSTQAGVNA